MKSACRLLAAVATLLLASCASPTPDRVRYADYPNIPDTPTCTLLRRVMKLQPWLSRHGFYGNYGGFGDNGGRPIDALDEVFRRHDIAYNELCGIRGLCLADGAAASAIARVDPRQLSAAGQSFRQRSYSFFAAPCWRWIGKPLSSYFIWHEAPDCPLRTREMIDTFFSMPDPEAASRYANRLQAAPRPAAKVPGKPPAG